MKKVILIAAIATLSTGVTAQTKLGVQAGGSLANFKSESTESGTTVKEKSKSKLGFLIGIVAEVPIGASLYFRPELNYIQKGGKFNESRSAAGFASVSTGEQTLHFIELPLNIVYSVPAGSGKVFFGAGPSIGYGISGKYEFTTTESIPGSPPVVQSQSGKGDIKFDGKKEADLSTSDNDAHLKALAFSGNMLAGYKMSNGLYINVGYTLGLNNINPNPNTSFKTSGFTFKLGYMIGGNASKD